MYYISEHHWHTELRPLIIQLMDAYQADALDIDSFYDAETGRVDLDAMFHSDAWPDGELSTNWQGNILNNLPDYQTPYPYTDFTNADQRYRLYARITGERIEGNIDADGRQYYVQPIEYLFISPDGELVGTFPGTNGGYDANQVPGFRYDASLPAANANGDNVNAFYPFVSPEETLVDGWIAGGGYTCNSGLTFRTQLLTPGYVPSLVEDPVSGWGVHRPGENSSDTRSLFWHQDGGPAGTNGCFGISCGDLATPDQMIAAYQAMEAFNAIPPELRPLGIAIIDPQDMSYREPLRLQGMPQAGNAPPEIALIGADATSYGNLSPDAIRNTPSTLATMLL